MLPYDQLVIAVKEVCIERKGRLALPCPVAFQLAERLEVELSAVAEVCNREDIKIAQCQLGCF